ncbi:MAG: hypothetical protein HY216_08535 [Candidatus Rokubacteria bacterium]|nr:hypothetical protein [Candidatus Rokubacteria bacterium]
MSRFPAAKCLNLSQGLGPMLRAIRTHLMARREESERARSTLAEQLGRCQYAEPLRTGYYCTLTGPCPYGEEFQVTIKGTDHHRCPKRPFHLRDAEHVGLMSWRGTPDEKTIIECRAQAMDLIAHGKTHLVINCQGLEWAPFNLFEILADVEQQLAHRPDAGVDVINLSSELLTAFRKMEPYLVGIQVHGRVMVELESASAPNA